MLIIYSNGNSCAAIEHRPEPNTDNGFIALIVYKKIKHLVLITQSIVPGAFDFRYKVIHIKRPARKSKVEITSACVG